jgi:hypothetical protein
MTREKWRPVLGFERVYEVSNLGNVRRVGRAPGAKTGYVLKGRPCRKGYLRVVLHDVGRRAERAVHHLVLEAFCSPRPDGLQANHKDGDKANNAVTNLEWVTASDNMRHARVTGLRPSFAGTANPRAKLRPEDIPVIRSLRGQEHQRVTAARYGVSKSLIGAVQCGEIWKHIQPPSDWPEIEQTLGGPS